MKILGDNQLISFENSFVSHSSSFFQNFDFKQLEVKMYLVYYNQKI